jgi:plasmid stabilization system protein ParE
VNVLFSDQAKAGLREIGRYIARDNKSRALSFVRALRTKARRIGAMPEAFPLVPRYASHGIRRRVFGQYAIFYRIESDRVVIVQILHSARDLDTLLFSDA